jgi:spatacsin
VIFIFFCLQYGKEGVYQYRKFIFQENGFGLEHHLHRGRALAAFNQILGHRVQNLKSEQEGSSSSHDQTNIQSDVQKLLSPLGQGEDTLLSSVSFLFLS